MVSFNVCSLYKNIPISDTLNIIKDYINNDDQFTRKRTIPQDKFLDLVNLILATTCYTSSSQFYQQTDSVAMGGPAFLTTAEIYMEAHERIVISTALHPPKKFGNNLLMTFILFLNLRTWKTFSITSRIFIKLLSLLWRRKVMEN